MSHRGEVRLASVSKTDSETGALILGTLAKLKDGSNSLS